MGPQATSCILVLSPSVKRIGREANHSSQNNTEFKNMWSYTSTLLVEKRHLYINIYPYSDTNPLDGFVGLWVANICKENDCTKVRNSFLFEPRNTHLRNYSVIYIYISSFILYTNIFQSFFLPYSGCLIIEIQTAK